MGDITKILEVISITLLLKNYLKNYVNLIILYIAFYTIKITFRVELSKTYCSQ